MAEDFDVEALLEEAYSKDTEGGRSNHSGDERRRSSDVSRERRRSRSKDRGGRERSRERRRRSRSGGRRSRSGGRRSRDRRRSRSPYKRRSRSRERDRYYDRRKSPPRYRRRTPSPPYKRRDNQNFIGAQSLRHDDYDDRDELTQDDRDQRTVFCMQLAANITPRELERFFSEAGKVRDVRIISDKGARRSKGIAYVEFADIEAAMEAVKMSGKKLMGIPIVVHPSNAEKNKVGNSSQTFLAAASTTYGPLRLYVGSLHFNIDEEMLRSIFKPYGVIEKVEWVKDNETGRSRGYGFVTFSNPDNARRAQEQLNGFELAGRAMRVNTVNDRNDLLGAGLDTDEMDRSGVDLGSTGRLQLMAKLAEGTGVQVPKVRPPMPMGQLPQGSQSMHQPHIIQRQPIPIPLPSSTQFPPTNLAQTTTAPSQCFVLKNMFNPEQESGGNWDVEIRNETINALQTFGGAVHVFVDKNNEQGSVFVKCPDAISADSAIQALNGRYFAVLIS